MAIIRDKAKTIEKLEKFFKKHKEDMAVVKIDKLEVPNKRTGKTDVVENIYICAINKGSDRPKIICGYIDSRNTYILHDDIAHQNVGGYRVTRVPNSKTNRLLTRAFCNPVHEIHLWEDPVKAKMILKGNLLETNPTSPMRRDAIPIRFDSSARFVRDMATNEIIKKDATFEQMLVRKLDLTELTENEKNLITDKRKFLEDNPNKVYAYVAANTYEIEPHFIWTFVDKEKLSEYATQDYYKNYTADDIDKAFVIPKTPYDICCVGLGSAGSNMLEQICKLNYFDKYRIIDFDRIDKKNLRNQTYSTDTLGSLKTDAMKNYIQSYAVNDTIKVYRQSSKYEYIDFKPLAIKYFISGFDTIKCRKGILDKIKSGEIETQYLIDARYDSLNSSLFFIDTSNKTEMEYYEKVLEETDKELNNKEEYRYDWTVDDVIQHYRDAWERGRCSETAYRLGMSSNMFETNICAYEDGTSYGCGGNSCIDCIKRALLRLHVPIPTEGCLEQNIIHIYKYTSSWVVSAVRGIEDNNTKPFTHVELTVNPIPNGMIIKK